MCVCVRVHTHSCVCMCACVCVCVCVCEPGSLCGRGYLRLSWQWNQIFVQKQSEKKIVNILNLLWSSKIKHDNTSLGSVQQYKNRNIITLTTLIDSYL